MKKFLSAAILFATVAAPANATYYWERTRNTHKADGSVLMVDPSSPASIGARNYQTLSDYRRGLCAEDCAPQQRDVLDVVQYTAPLRMPSMPVEQAPMVLAPTSVKASSAMMPSSDYPTNTTHYLTLPARMNQAAPETYDNTAVSPGYGYVEGAGTYVPLR